MKIPGEDLNKYEWEFLLGEIRRSDYSAIITKDLYLVNINITLRDSVGGCAQ